MRRLALVIAVLLGTSVHVVAEPRGYVGFAGTSCGSWIDARAKKESLAMEYWALGFVSGANGYADQGVDLVKGTDANAMWVWLDGFCRSQPLEPFIVAVQQLCLALEARAPLNQ